MSDIYGKYPVSILYNSTAGRYRPDGPITARYRLIKNAIWVWVASGEKVPSSMRKICGFTASCVCYPFIHSLVSDDSVIGQRRP